MSLAVSALLWGLASVGVVFLEEKINRDITDMTATIFEKSRTHHIHLLKPFTVLVIVRATAATVQYVV